MSTADSTRATAATRATGAIEGAGGWPAIVLADLADKDDLHVAPLRADATTHATTHGNAQGATYGTPTWVWSVQVDGQVYVRAYNGISSRWYRAAVQQRSGKITVAGADHEAVFSPVPSPHGDDQDDSNDGAGARLAGGIDQAYRDRYAGSPYLDHMVSDGPRAATVRLNPSSESAEEI